MKSKEALKLIKPRYILLLSSSIKTAQAYLVIEKDLELLDCFLNCFKSAILEATDSQYRRGDNILADKLRDELGLITLNRLKERLKNE